MIEYPIIPEGQADISRFLRDYLGRMAGVLQAFGEGKSYVNAKGVGKAQYWDDYTSSFNAARVAGANVPTWAVVKGGISAYRFSATAMNEVWPSPIHVDHTYKPGTAIYPHIHWCCPTTDTGVVRWGIEYTFAKGHQQGAGSVFPTTQTVYLEQAATGTAYEHMVIEATESAAIESANIEPDTLIMTRIFRDAAHANDTCTAAVFGLMHDMHYQKGFWATKNKSPNFYK